MNTMIRKFLKEEDGITALEYGILAAIVVSAISLTFGKTLQPFFAAIFTALETAAGVTPAAPAAGG
jgi:pilus assembly protein Flp/PilA